MFLCLPVGLKSCFFRFLCLPIGIKLCLMRFCVLQLVLNHVFCLELLYIAMENPKLYITLSVIDVNNNKKHPWKAYIIKNALNLIGLISIGYFFYMKLCTSKFLESGCKYSAIAKSTNVWFL